MRPPETNTVIVSNYGTGGSCLYLRQMAAAMKKSGFPVTFYIPKNTDMGDPDGSFFRYILREPSTHPAFLKAGPLKYAFHVIKYFSNTRLIRPGNEVRIVHLLFPFYLTDFMLVNRLRREGKKVVLTVHEVFPHRPFLGGNTDRKMIKKMYTKADILLAHTHSLKNELTDMFSLNPDKIFVVPHGYFSLSPSPLDLSTLKNKYRVPQDRKVLLFFGSIRENKGLDVLLKTMKKLKEDYFLLIAGETAGASEIGAGHYRTMIEKLEIADSVAWTEKYISDEEAAEVFGVADAVILPYRRSFHAQSGVLNLAAGFEKKCVVSDIGGMGEMVRDYRLGVVVEPEDADALEQGITRLFEEPDGSFGFQRYKDENSWEAAAGKYIGIYRNLLDPKDAITVGHEGRKTL